jgi:hypothetical protein
MLAVAHTSRKTPSRIPAALLPALVFMLSPALATAGDVEIKGGQCRSNVHVVARATPLSEVLAKLAKSLDFQLSFDSQNDPAVDIDVKRAPLEVIRQLIGSENVSVIQSSDPKCPDRDKIVKIWVLRNVTVVPASFVPPSGKSALPPKETDYVRKAKAEVEQYLRPQGAKEAPAQEETGSEETSD